VTMLLLSMDGCSKSDSAAERLRSTSHSSGTKNSWLLSLRSVL
jgi:hypothetical protein